jgi:hypothetical protein
VKIKIKMLKRCDNLLRCILLVDNYKDGSDFNFYVPYFTSVYPIIEIDSCIYFDLDIFIDKKALYKICDGEKVLLDIDEYWAINHIAIKSYFIRTTTDDVYKIYMLDGVDIDPDFYGEDLIHDVCRIINGTINKSAIYGYLVDIVRIDDEVLSTAKQKGYYNEIDC